MAATEIVHTDATLRLGISRNLVAAAWFDAPEVTHLRAIGEALRAAARRWGTALRRR